MPCVRTKQLSVEDYFLNDEDYFKKLNDNLYEEWPSEEATTETPVPEFLW